MKTQTTSNYARVLYELSISDEVIQQSRAILEEAPQLVSVFENPTVQLDKKLHIIDRVFPDEITRFLKVICKNQRMGQILEILEAYTEYVKAQKRTVSANLEYVVLPDEEQQEKLKAFILRKYDADGVEFTTNENKSLIGGFILKVGSDEYDWSTSGRLQRLEQQLTRR